MKRALILSASAGSGKTFRLVLKYICDIIISNLNTFAQRTLLEDGVDDNGMKVTIDVKKGNTLRINVTAIKDADGNYYPAADMVWVGNFSNPE